MPSKKCSVEQCDRKHKARWLCAKHYLNERKNHVWEWKDFRKHRPAIIKWKIALLPLGVGARDWYAKVDIEFSYLDEYKWHVNNAWYASRYVYKNRNQELLHHIICGRAPKGKVVDHINRDKLDNRKSNLRHVTQWENLHNTWPQKNNTSGYKWVVYEKDRKMWRADITCNGQRIYLGTYKEVSEAVQARLKAEAIYYAKAW